MLIEGEIRNNNYTNRNGENVYSVQIVTSSVEFAESRRAQEQQTPPPMPEGDGFMNIPAGMEEDRPFS